MLLDLSINLLELKDLFAYAAEILILFTAMVVLIQCTLLSTGVRYPLVMEYAGRLCGYGLLLAFYLLWEQWISFGLDATLFSLQASLVQTEEILLWKLVITVLAGVILLVSEAYFRETRMGYFEYHLLYLVSFLGCLVTLSTNDFMTLYISLEIQALAFYVMSTLRKTSATSEAGLKYFIIGSFSSALLLFGISLVVLLTGQQNFQGVAYFLYFPSVGSSHGFLVFGAILILVALLIKLSVAPFHEWVADVYEGLMTPTALFFATVPKVSNFFLLVRLVQEVFGAFFNEVQWVLALAAFLSLVLGSLQALRQQSIRRFLAFSSVNHFGFILLGLVVGTAGGVSASTTYLSFYLILTFGMWTSLLLLTYSQGNQVHQLTRILELAGLAHGKPALALGIMVMLLSMGAVPPLAGFNAKISVFYSLLTSVYAYSPVLLITALASSVLSVYYYIRVIKILTFLSPVRGSTLTKAWSTEGSMSGAVASYVVAAVVVFNVFAFLLFL